MQSSTLAVLNSELGTPVSVANETLNRGAAIPWFLKSIHAVLRVAPF